MVVLKIAYVFMQRKTH